MRRAIGERQPLLSAPVSEQLPRSATCGSDATLLAIDGWPQCATARDGEFNEPTASA